MTCPWLQRRRQRGGQPPVWRLSRRLLVRSRLPPFQALRQARMVASVSPRHHRLRLPRHPDRRVSPRPQQALPWRHSFRPGRRRLRPAHMYPLARLLERDPRSRLKWCLRGQPHRTMLLRPRDRRRVGIPRHPPRNRRRAARLPGQAALRSPIRTLPLRSRRPRQANTPPPRTSLPRASLDGLRSGRPPPATGDRRWQRNPARRLHRPGPPPRPSQGTHLVTAPTSRPTLRGSSKFLAATCSG